ncbi:winged helix-turn-helix domain-containing protein [Dokdonella sp.]|uniref:winged helix-turn-helix domain-containing protein n=1 Tax=Dokdonella sp. TaxID=2291710 RepID=UPI003529CDC0
MDTGGRESFQSIGNNSVSLSGETGFRVGSCLVLPDQDLIVGASGKCSVEPKAMAVLVHLARQPDRVVSADELIDHVWLGRPMGDNPVYRCIAQLRRALGDDPRSPRYVLTVPTKGYRLIAPIAPLDVEPEQPLPELTAPDNEPEPPRATHAGRVRADWRSRRVVLLLLALVLAGVLVARWLADRAETDDPAAIDRQGLAVLPFRAEADDEASRLISQSVTDLVRNRFAALSKLTVVAAGSATVDAETPDEIRAVGARLGVQYLLQGRVGVATDRLRVDVRLLDSAAGKALWSARYDEPIADVARIREGIFQEVAGKLGIDAEAAAGKSPGNARVSLDAYELYMRGRNLLSSQAAGDIDRAIEAFRRTTVLDPEFSLGYLGLCQALMLKIRRGGEQEAEWRTMAEKALDRALAINPALGQAWIERAGLTADPAVAEEHYRKGLLLAPNEGTGYLRYAQFLFGSSRMGEAIDTIDRAIRIDPLNPELYLLQAFYVMVVRSDVAEHDRLVRHALEINPNMTRALYQLAYSHWEYSGRLAEAARVIERAIKKDPDSIDMRVLARDIYLDLGDPVAAASVLGPSPPAEVIAELARYDGDSTQLAAYASDIDPASWPDSGPRAPLAEALRDAMLQSGDMQAGLALLASVAAARETYPPMWSRGFSLVHANALVLSGKPEEGRRIASAMLDVLDTHGQGRTRNWFGRERSLALAILGEDERALDALASSIGNGQIYRWWYLARFDPVYSGLREHPRFDQISRQVQAHLARQRSLLQDMRQQGDLPIRDVVNHPESR